MSTQYQANGHFCLANPDPGGSPKVRKEAGSQAQLLRPQFPLWEPAEVGGDGVRTPVSPPPAAPPGASSGPHAGGTFPACRAKQPRFCAELMELQLKQGKRRREGAAGRGNRLRAAGRGGLCPLSSTGAGVSVDPESQLRVVSADQRGAASLPCSAVTHRAETLPQRSANLPWHRGTRSVPGRLGRSVSAKLPSGGEGTVILQGNDQGGFPVVVGWQGEHSQSPQR